MWLAPGLLLLVQGPQCKSWTMRIMTHQQTTIKWLSTFSLINLRIRCKRATHKVTKLFNRWFRMESQHAWMKQLFSQSIGLELNVGWMFKLWIERRSDHKIATRHCFKELEKSIFITKRLFLVHEYYWFTNFNNTDDDNEIKTFNIRH